MGREKLIQYCFCLKQFLLIVFQRGIVSQTERYHCTGTASLREGLFPSGNYYKRFVNFFLRHTLNLIKKYHCHFSFGANYH